MRSLVLSCHMGVICSQKTNVAFRWFSIFVCSFVFIFKIHIYFQLCQVLVAACGISFPDQGSNLGLLHWEHGV